MVRTNGAVVILSGGLDSTTLLHEVKNMGYRTYALSFDYNQRHKKELEFARRTCEKLKIPHKVVDISNINELIKGSSLTDDNIKVPEGHYTDEVMKLTVVPNRNMILLSLAVGYAISVNAINVFYGAHAGDHDIYPDCRKEFVKAMQEVAKKCHYWKINIKAPYLNINKTTILKKGLRIGVDYGLTWTCYKGQDKACGKCGSCVERLESFKAVGRKDPLEYEK